MIRHHLSISLTAWTAILSFLTTTLCAGDGDAWASFRDAGCQGQSSASTTVIASLTALAFDRTGTGAERRFHARNVLDRGSVALAAAVMMSEHLADTLTAHAAGTFSMRTRGDRFDHAAISALRHLERNVPTMNISAMDRLGTVRCIPLIGIGGDLERAEITFTQGVLTDWVTITAPRTMRTDSAPQESLLHATCLLACALETDLVFEHRHGPRLSEVTGDRPIIDPIRANRAIQPVVYHACTDRVRSLLLRQHLNPTDPETQPILRGLADAIRPSTNQGAEASVIGFLACLDGSDTAAGSAAAGWQVVLQLPRRQP